MPHQASKEIMPRAYVAGQRSEGAKQVFKIGNEMRSQKFWSESGMLSIALQETLVAVCQTN
jgi:hypothetical protein